MNKASAWRLPVLLVLLAAGTAALLLRSRHAGRAEVRLPATLDGADPAFDLGAEPIFLQGDTRWGDERLGGSGEPLRAVGCVVCCLSMALAHHGIDIEPDTLNRELTRHDGFTPRGWVKWAAVGPVSGDKVRIRIPDAPDPDDLLDALRAGNPVIVKVWLRSGIQHWVLVVGRAGRDYLIKDPLGDGKRLDRLSKFSSDILSVRIIEKAE